MDWMWDERDREESRMYGEQNPVPYVPLPGVTPMVML